jgi:predicted AlkP superfamily pyrophosphatase or phosphodiesterase
VGIVLLLLVSCSRAQAPATAPATQPTVVWISIDGLRHDYLNRIAPPTLSRLAREGAISTRVKPVFPSLTFPNHIAQVTGRSVAGHGIPLNRFFDTERKQVLSFPSEPDLLRAEPIWVAAKRQGVRVAVIDWPISYARRGPNQSDYTEIRYDGERTDQQRLDHVAHILRVDPGNPPLRLIISYMSRVDTIGHRNGPDSAETAQALREADATLDSFHKALIKWFDQTHGSADELYLLITTDHGMSNVHTLASMERLIGADLAQGARIITDGGMAMIYLNDLPADQRAPRGRAIVERLKSFNYLRAWVRADVPVEYHFNDPVRIGEVVVALSPGYAWSTQRNSTTQPAQTGRLGNHGFDPAHPDMQGMAILWRHRQNLGGADLGPIENTQWHATVARLLGIEPASGADPRPITLPARPTSTYSVVPESRSR